jgi:tetratricopeptide (TPR) repeat protein
MAVKTEKELNQTQRNLWLKAVAAVELRNLGYAISLLQEILKQEPRFLTGRQLLRRTEVTKNKSTKRSFFNISTAPIAVMKAQREIKKDPKRAVEMLEKVLEDEPYNRQANLALKEAATAAGWPEIGVFALRTLLEENPRDVKVLHELGRLYRELGENDQEVDVYNLIIELNPLDAEALRRGKDAAAHASMKSGGWTQAESYRDLIKDKEMAISLEQQSRIRLTGESLEQQIAETHARHKAEPKNVDLARRLAVLNEEKEDLEAAIGWYQCAADLTKGADTGLVRKVSDLKIKCLEREVAAHEEFLSTHNAAHELYAKKSEELKAAKAKLAEILIADARERVARNPTDLQLRFELGEQLVSARGLDELPQIFNVLCGEMSLVGPRPCLPNEFTHYELWQRERVNGLPGMTGYWQVNGKNKTTFNEMIAMDLFYLKNISFLLDLKIIFKTCGVMAGQVFESRSTTQPGRQDERLGSPAPTLQRLAESARKV